MKLNASQQLVLGMLRQGSVTTRQFIAGGAGNRFSARIKELRELGFVITTEQQKRGAVYRLVRDVERAAGSPPLAGRSPGAPASAPRSDPPADQRPQVEAPAGSHSAAKPEPLFNLEPDRPGLMDAEEVA